MNEVATSAVGMILGLVLCIVLGGAVLTTVWAFFRLLEFMADPHVSFGGVWRRCTHLLPFRSSGNTRSAEETRPD